MPGELTTASAADRSGNPSAGCAPPGSWRQRYVPAFLAAAVLFYSFVFCFKAGERGFFALDQSIEFDGAYRILAGQVPYKDFIIPVGPGVFWLQAIVFKLFGINFTAFLVGAALVNLLATALSMVTVALLFPGKPWPALIAGFLTATWFYPPYGTPNMEQTAFFFSLISITCLCATARSTCSDVMRGLLCIAAGACAAAAFLSKQNAGLLVAPVYFFLLLAINLASGRGFWMSLVWFLLGTAGLTAAFLTWLVLQSDPALFVEHFFTIPSRLGMGRILASRPKLLGDLLGGNASFLPVAMYLSAFVGVAILVILVRRKPLDGAPRLAVASILCIYLQFFQNAFSVTTCNQWQECMPFVGLVFGCAAGLLAWLFERQTDASTSSQAGWGAATLLLIASIIGSLITRTTLPQVAGCILVLLGMILGMFGRPHAATTVADVQYAISAIRRKKRREQMALFVTVVVVGCGFQGMRASWNRSVHDIFRGAVFTDYLPVPGLEHLKWGKPTIVQDVEFRDDDMTRLVSLLEQESRPFFVFPEFTLLYGLVGAPSPQPLLWFHKGLTYPQEYDEDLDRWIVDSLVRENVQLVVLQESWHFKSELCALTHFPLLDAYIREQFVPDQQLGSFTVLRQKDTGAVASLDHTRLIQPATSR